MKTCITCSRELIRKTWDSGDKEQLRYFLNRKYCDKKCYRSREKKVYIRKTFTLYFSEHQIGRVFKEYADHYKSESGGYYPNEMISMPDLIEGLKAQRISRNIQQL